MMKRFFFVIAGCLVALATASGQTSRTPSKRVRVPDLKSQIPVSETVTSEPADDSVGGKGNPGSYGQKRRSNISAADLRAILRLWGKLYQEGCRNIDFTCLCSSGPISGSRLGDMVGYDMELDRCYQNMRLFTLFHTQPTDMCYQLIGYTPTPSDARCTVEWSCNDTCRP